MSDTPDQSNNPEPPSHDGFERPSIDRTAAEEVSVEDEARANREKGSGIEKAKEALLRSAEDEEQDAEKAHEHRKRSGRLWKIIGGIVVLVIVAGAAVGGLYLHHVEKQEKAVARTAEAVRKASINLANGTDQDEALISAAIALARANLTGPDLESAIRELAVKHQLNPAQVAKLQELAVDAQRRLMRGESASQIASDARLDRALTRGGATSLDSADLLGFAASNVVARSGAEDPSAVVSSIVGRLTQEAKERGLHQDAVANALLKSVRDIPRDTPPEQRARMEEKLREAALRAQTEHLVEGARAAGYDDRQLITNTVSAITAYAKANGIDPQNAAEIAKEYLINQGLSPRAIDEEITIQRTIERLPFGSKGHDPIIEARRLLIANTEDESPAERTSVIARGIARASMMAGLGLAESTTEAAVGTTAAVVPTGGSAIAATTELLQGATLNSAEKEILAAQQKAFEEALAQGDSVEVATLKALAAGAKVARELQVDGDVLQRMSENLIVAATRVGLSAEGADKALAQARSFVASHNANRSTEETILAALADTQAAMDRAGITDNSLVLQVAEAAAPIAEQDDERLALAKARAVAQHLARQAGLSDIEVQMAAAMADARVRAERAGLNSAEQDAIAARAAEKVGRAAGSSDGQIASSINLVNQAQAAARSPIENVGFRARLEVAEQGGTVLEQEIAANLAMLAHIADQQKVPGTVYDISAAMLEARTKAIGLGLSEAEVNELARQAGQTAARQMGITGEQLQHLMPQIDELLSYPYLASRTEDSQKHEDGSEARAVQQQTLKLEIRLDRLESQVAELMVLRNDIESLKTTIMQLAAKQDRFEKTIQSSISESVKGLKETVQTVQKENTTLQSNFGWISNRVCATEALLDHYENPRACDEIYSRMSDDYRHAAIAAKRAVNPDAVAMPETDSGRSQSKKPILDAPTTVNPQAAIDEKSANACRHADKSWRYAAIWGNGAVIERFDGLRVELSEGMKVDDLGAALFFQVNREPRFIQLEHGVICRS